MRWQKSVLNDCLCQRCIPQLIVYFYTCTSDVAEFPQKICYADYIKGLDVKEI